VSGHKENEPIFSKLFLAFKSITKFFIISSPVTNDVVTNDWLWIISSTNPMLECIKLWRGFCSIKYGRKLEVDEVLCHSEKARYIFLWDQDQRWTIAEEQGLDAVVVKCFGCPDCPKDSEE